MADLGLGPPFSKALPFHFPISPSRFHSAPRSLTMAADHPHSYSFSNPNPIPDPSTSQPSLLVFSGQSSSLLFMLSLFPAEQWQKMYEKRAGNWNRSYNHVQSIAIDKYDRLNRRISVQGFPLLSALELGVEAALKGMKGKCCLGACHNYYNYLARDRTLTKFLDLCTMEKKTVDHLLWHCPVLHEAFAEKKMRRVVPMCGTAFNGVVEELKKLTTCVAHVLPVSDDGGSTAEIVRVLGGPAVGDIRSRCLRLSDQSTSEALAVRKLLGHRLPLDAQAAKLEWYQIVEGEHALWEGVSKPYRETIRSFLAYFQNQILRRSKESFCFSNGSIGNFFFAGARIFFDSLDAAIFLFSRVSDIPTESLILPVISTNDRLTLGCELWEVMGLSHLSFTNSTVSPHVRDGSIIRGQNEISHPTSGSMQPINKEISSVPPLPSAIKRVFYMSSEGRNLLHEVFPTANPAVLDQLSNVDCIVYAMGSLFTSICPSLVLLGIGEIISSSSCLKVLLLNGTHDRETSGFSASRFVSAITDALNRTYGDPQNRLKNPPSQYINTLLVPKDGQIPVDVQCLASQGIFHVVRMPSTFI
ncbi:Uncharacterized protein YNL011C [Vitis vinifera]|uniref:Uncharacterized protein YNL011C n=1 Tax=Vitis vinifera TaxID=29760 RepID=A0A438C6J1_VITVI|nr:Uncharacterized protein YNL011C [Vitis vinifera]